MAQYVLDYNDHALLELNSWYVLGYYAGEKLSQDRNCLLLDTVCLTYRDENIIHVISDSGTFYSFLSKF